MDKLIVESFYGFGDNLFLRPLLLEEAKTKEVYVQTPYPELFLNTNVVPIKPGAFLYDFANRAMDSAHGYGNKPQDGKFIRPHYSVQDLKDYRTLSYSFSRGFNNKVMDTRLTVTKEQLLLGAELLSDVSGPVMLIKIPSYRHDWMCESRTPKTQYMIECIKMARERDLKIVSLQDYTLGDRLGEPELEKEWLPLCDKLLHGKLSINQLVGLFSLSDCVLTYPNFLLPLAIYLDKPVFCIYGGSVHPATIIDPRIAPSHYSYVAPKPFCHCVESHHDCNKEIPLDVVRGKFEQFLITRHHPPDKLMWDEDRGYGYYPVENNGVYDDSYFDKYMGYEKTEFGERLNSERVKLAIRFSNNDIIDIGIGSGQFLRASGAMGYDVCPKAVEWLKNNCRWVDFYNRGAYNADLVTFFDSFEHIDDIETVVKMCMGRNILISIPIFRDREHVLASKHFRKDEHYHYFTDKGLKDWFAIRNYECVFQSDIETQLGREGIETYVFSYKQLSHIQDVVYE